MTDVIAELERLTRMKADGAITEEEFALLKARLLSKGATAAAEPPKSDPPPPNGALAPPAQPHDPKTSAIVAAVIGGLIGLYLAGRWLMSHAVDLFTFGVMFLDLFGPLIAVILVVRWINGLVNKLADSRRDDR